jgi:hypothetical protein
MRTTVHLDDDVYEVVKAKAAQENSSLGKVLSELVRRGMRRRSSSNPKGDFPVFEVRPGAAPLTVEMVKRALEEG